MALDVNAELGAALVTAYWISADAMKANEHDIASVMEKTERCSGGTSSVERYELSSFTQAARPRAGSCARVTRGELETADVDDSVANYEDSAVPWLLSTEGFCRAVMLVNRRTREAANETVWVDHDALVASRSAEAGIRADMVAATTEGIRSLEEYDLAFSSARRL